MSHARQSPTQRMIERVIKAVRATGLYVVAVQPDGTVLTDDKPVTTANEPLDNTTAAPGRSGEAAVRLMSSEDDPVGRDRIRYFLFLNGRWRWRPTKAMRSHGFGLITMGRGGPGSDADGDPEAKR